MTIQKILMSLSAILFVAACSSTPPAPTETLPPAVESAPPPPPPPAAEPPPPPPNETARRHKGPPPEAIEACADKSAGDACSFTGRYKDAVKGTCSKAPKGDVLDCKPGPGPKKKK